MNAIELDFHVVLFVFRYCAKKFRNFDIYIVNLNIIGSQLKGFGFRTLRAQTDSLLLFVEPKIRLSFGRQLHFLILFYRYNNTDNCISTILKKINSRKTEKLALKANIAYRLYKTYPTIIEASSLPGSFLFYIFNMAAMDDDRASPIFRRRAFAQ